MIKIWNTMNPKRGDDVDLKSQARLEEEEGKGKEEGEDIACREKGL